MINTNETDDKTVSAIAFGEDEKTGEVKEEDLTLSIVPQNHLNPDKVTVDSKGEKILNEKHRKEIIEDSCVSEVIAQSAFFTIDQDCDSVAYLGFNPGSNSEDAEGYRDEGRSVSGWATRCVKPTTGKEDKLAGQFKPDHPSPKLGKDGKPKKGKDGKPKVNRYLGRIRGNTPMFLAMPDPQFWYKLIDECDQGKERTIIITEGAKKAAAGLTLGYPTIALSGVNNAGDRDPVVPDEIHRDIQDFLVPGTTVVIAYDADWWTNERVKLAILHLAKNLEKFDGVIVKTLLLPNDPEAKGIDDFIKKHGAEAFHNVIANAGSNIWSEGEIKGHEFGKLLDTHLAPRMRFNSLSQKYEVDGKEISLEEMTCLLEDECKVIFATQSLTNRLEGYRTKLAYNPVVDYLNGLKDNLPPVDTVAAKDYFEEFVKDFFGSNDEDGSKLTDAKKVKRWAISAIARAYEPGCKVDTALILLSPDQGIGKTNFFTTLANGHYVNMSSTATDKDGILVQQAGWLIDMGEIDATFNAKDVSAIKNNMTIQEDRVRPPYGRSIQTYKRHSVFCGTCNEEKFLRDSTGSRRFLVVKARKVLLGKEVEAERDTFWQNALSLYLAGERWYFTKEESDQISAENEQYSEENPYLETIALALERACGEGKMPNTALTSDQICTLLLNLPVGSVKGKAGKQVAQAMKSLGYEPKRIRVGEKSTQVTAYVKPEWGNDHKFFTSRSDCATWFH